jgi:hypothetical protein
MASMRATSKVTLRALSHTVLAAAWGTTPSSARASVAWASISNQMRNLVCGSQMETIGSRA